MTIGNLFTALRQGYILKNAESWKNRTVAVNALMALITVALAVAGEFGYALKLDDEIVSAAAVTVWGLFNAWSTVATTAKIGLPSKPDGGGLDGERSGPGSGV